MSDTPEHEDIKNQIIALRVKDYEQLERELAAMTKRADEMERLKEHNAQLFYRIERELADLKAQHAWRPIETAPKDGTRVLVLFKECVSIAHFANDGDGLCWMDDDFDSLALVVQPTHWQPLPEPPKEGAE